MAGRSMAARTAMMLTTTSNSRSVNPRRAAEDRRNFMTRLLEMPKSSQIRNAKSGGAAISDCKLRKVDEVNVGEAPEAVKKNPRTREPYSPGASHRVI